MEFSGVNDDELSAFRLQRFILGLLEERGLAAAAGAACASLVGTGNEKIWANTFRKYAHGQLRPRSNAVWLFARSVSSGTRHKWCAGPLALDYAAEFRDLILVLAYWKKHSGRDLSHHIKSLSSAGTMLPSDLEPELAEYYEMSKADSAHPDHEAVIQTYVARGYIADFESAKRAFSHRMRARQVWALDSELESEVETAWERVNKGAGEEFWTDRDLAVALAVAEAKQINLTMKREIIFGILQHWGRNVSRKVA